VIVDKSASGKRVAVLFMTSPGGNSGGLVFLHGYPPPSDTCNTHLSGPWWQLSPLNYTTNGCAEVSTSPRRVNRSSIHLTSTGTPRSL